MTVKVIGEELDIPAFTLYNWVAQYREFENGSIASVESIRELERQLKQKERELDNAKEELAIVKSQHTSSANQ